MKAGAVDFLTKPFREQDMLDAVAIAITRDRVRREGVKVHPGCALCLETLRPREREVMALVMSGLMNKQVAAKTGLAESTVKMHREQVMRKIGAKSLADLVKMAEIIDVHGNSFRHRPSNELEVASGACAPDPRPGKPPTDDRRFFHAALATRSAGRAGLETAALESCRRLQRVEPMREVVGHTNRKAWRLPRSAARQNKVSSIASRQQPGSFGDEDTRSARAGQSQQS